MRNCPVGRGVLANREEFGSAGAERDLSHPLDLALGAFYFRESHSPDASNLHPMFLGYHSGKEQLGRGADPDVPP